MPHLIVEYAEELENDIDIQALAEAVFDGAEESALFETSHIKTRCHPVSAYFVGGKRETFVHVNAKIQPGRTEDQKKMLGDKVIAAVKSCAGDIKVSVEVNDLPASYTKG